VVKAVVKDVPAFPVGEGATAQRARSWFASPFRKLNFPCGLLCVCGQVPTRIAARFPPPLTEKGCGSRLRARWCG
jgi:hypothetical protein